MTANKGRLAEILRSTISEKSADQSDESDPESASASFMVANSIQDDLIIARKDEAAAQVATLDDDELRLLQRIMLGWSMAEIDENFGATIPELERQRVNIMLKLSANCTTDLFRIGIYAGLDQ